MPSATLMTEETMKYNSIMATHNALLELGRQDESQKNSEKLIDIENQEIILFLEKYLAVVDYFETSGKSQTSNMSFETPERLRELINKPLKHIHKLNSIIEENKNKYEKLHDENSDLQDQNKELIEETEQLEDEKEKIILATNQRIEKLRNICIKRNNTIKNYKIITIILIIHLLIISYIGIFNYYIILKNIIVKIIYTMVLMLKLSSEFINYNIYCYNYFKNKCINLLSDIYLILKLIFNLSYEFINMYYLLGIMIYDNIKNSVFATDIEFNNSMNYINITENMCYI
jgi:FtsZ-binding cell division protein ZapB